ncbi:histidine phosphatase family protein [Halocynthiibacter namhaensis]|uniref:histidine phosphatase family protein n=1 Tax=Halocynthiibacter namhaensis TaxID=1290553 RepID=UPI0005791954|nr:histidine phosphatase family protein [Halocynthiibacter namhaensis]
MGLLASSVLTLVRHAPVVGDGCMYGRRDLAANCTDVAAFAQVTAMLPTPARLIASPAIRCIQTAKMLWPNQMPTPASALWEQNFGDWEGLPYAQLPDLGDVSATDLAAYRGHGGESFDDVVARVSAGLRDIAREGSATCVVHAGTIRAAIAMAVGAPGALAFSVDNLSATQITILPDGVAINYVNRSA